MLETERLRLRGHRLDDFEASAAMWSDPRVVRYISGRPSTGQQSWSRLLAYVGHWRLLGFGYWAVEDKANGSFVGECGFADFKRENAPALGGYPEIGWAFASAVHGRGYGAEAARAAVAWADATLDAARTVCMIDPENAASLRVAAACGYRAFERGVFHDSPTLFLARDRPRRSG